MKSSLDQFFGSGDRKYLNPLDLPELLGWRFPIHKPWYGNLLDHLEIKLSLRSTADKVVDTKSERQLSKNPPRIFLNTDLNGLCWSFEVCQSIFAPTDENIAIQFLMFASHFSVKEKYSYESVASFAKDCFGFQLNRSKYESIFQARQFTPLRTLLSNQSVSHLHHFFESGLLKQRDTGEFVTSRTVFIAHFEIETRKKFWKRATTEGAKLFGNDDNEVRDTRDWKFRKIYDDCVVIESKHQESSVLIKPFRKELLIRLSARLKTN